MGRHYRVMTLPTELREPSNLLNFISGSAKRKLTETLKDYIWRSVRYRNVARLFVKLPNIYHTDI